MKRKLVTILLSINFTACGTNNSESSERISKNNEPDKIETDSEQIDQESAGNPTDDREEASENPDTIGDIDVDKGVFDVVLTIPAELVGETTQEELDEKASEYGYKVTLNADGSATYTMTKSQHKEMLENM